MFRKAAIRGCGCCSRDDHSLARHLSYACCLARMQVVVSSHVSLSTCSVRLPVASICFQLRFGGKQRCMSVVHEKFDVGMTCAKIQQQLKVGV